LVPLVFFCIEATPCYSKEPINVAPSQEPIAISSNNILKCNYYNIKCFSKDNARSFGV
jgi:hypothetical protein